MLVAASRPAVSTTRVRLAGYTASIRARTEPLSRDHVKRTCPPAPSYTSTR